jgi:hypothetical protein
VRRGWEEEVEVRNEELGLGNQPAAFLIYRNHRSTVRCESTAQIAPGVLGLLLAQAGLRFPGPGPGCGLGAGEHARALCIAGRGPAITSGPLSRAGRPGLAGMGYALGHALLHGLCARCCWEWAASGRAMGLRAEKVQKNMFRFIVFQKQFWRNFV